jgi:hypothetical protein
MEHKKIIVVFVIVIITAVTVWLIVGKGDVSEKNTNPIYLENNEDNETLVSDKDSDHEEKHREEHEIEGMPIGYSVVDLPTSGLVNTVTNPNPSKEFERVLSDVHLDLYWVEECRSPTGPERALMFVAKPSLDPKGGDIEGVKILVKDWEPYMAQDIGGIVYGYKHESFKEVRLSFYDDDSGDSRKANFMIGNTQYELHYGWILNFLIMAPSKNCLTAVINNTYAPHAH